MASLDHNTRCSDRKHNLDNKLDIMMKDIAIQARSQYISKTLNATNPNIFDQNQRKLLNFKAKVPQKMIKFKNKSEQQRYLRVANCIIALNDPQNTTQ